jgi:hypothetical protein
MKILNRLRLGQATKPELVAISGTGNFTARISDLRSEGHSIACTHKYPDGITTYRLREGC